MFRKIYNFIKYRQYKMGFDPKLQDERDFELGWSLFGSNYAPKNIRINNKPDWQPIRNQKNINSCVCESGCGQKEKDEGLELSAQDMATYLRSLGQMSINGTSLSYFQNALKNRGVAEKDLYPNSYDVSWTEFSKPERLTQLITNNAANHKSSSFYKTTDTNQILEELDNGKIGHTACDWYDGYYSNAIKNNNFILSPFRGSKTGGHAIRVVGYDTNYKGNKVFIMENSWGKEYGDSGLFYIKFEDYTKLCIYGTYFNSDIEKNVMGFISMYQNFPVKSPNDPKCYLIKGKQKRHIPDEALFEMLDFTWKDLIDDKENILADVEEGLPLTFDDLSFDQKSRAEMRITQYGNADFFKSRYLKYFPNLLK